MLLVSSLARNLKIFTSTLTAIAQVLTVYRVTYRYASRRFGWEDACAVVALIGSVICVVTSWTHFELVGRPSVISFWIYALTYPSVVWSVRLSILLSILRITSPSRSLRHAMLFIAGLFVLACFSLTISFVARSVSDHRWYSIPDQRNMKWTLSLAIFELITDILSNSALLGLAIYSLRSVKLSLSRRRLIIAAFSSNILVTIVSFFRAICQVLRISTLSSVAIDIEIACSLYVCNSLFITTRVYRMLHRNDTAIEANTEIPTSEDTLQFTTIDLDALEASESNTSGSISFRSLTTTRVSHGTEKHDDTISSQYGTNLERCQSSTQCH